MQGNKIVLKNYGKYYLNFVEKTLMICTGFIISLSIAYMFFDNLVMMGIFFPPAVIISVKSYKKTRIKKNKKMLERQFEELLNSLEELLRTGYSIENSFFEARKQLHIIYEKADILNELDYICNGLKMNQTIEKLMDNVAARSGIEDIMVFSELLAISKKSGGNLIKIVKQNATILHDKRQVIEDIATVITAKKLENRVMNIMPAGIVLYLKISSPEFMEVLYNNVIGNSVMIFCMVIYVAAIMLGRHITDFEKIGIIGIKKKEGTKNNKKIQKKSLVYSFLIKSYLKEPINKINDQIKRLYPTQDTEPLILSFWNSIFLKELLAVIGVAIAICLYTVSGNISNSRYLICVMIIAVILIPFGMIENIKEMMKKRKKQLEADYPIIVDRFSLIMSAGVSMRSAWENIVKDYSQKRLEKKIGIHYAYEEMQYSVGQMSQGLSESFAYEDFGKRTMILPYIKFSTMLVQNLKRGNRELLEQLQLASIDALYTRKESVKRLGEEASSKLLIPMAMQFIIILIIIMYPALAGLRI